MRVYLFITTNSSILSMSLRHIQWFIAYKRYKYDVRWHRYRIQMELSLALMPNDREIVALDTVYSEFLNPFYFCDGKKTMKRFVLHFIRMMILNFCNIVKKNVHFSFKFDKLHSLFHSLPFCFHYISYIGVVLVNMQRQQNLLMRNIIRSKREKVSFWTQAGFLVFRIVK